MCVGAWYKWCGTNPCDSCSGCYRYDGTCDTTDKTSELLCLQDGGQNQWCGAAGLTCTGCSYCYTMSDNGGSMCDSGHMEGSACTTYNTGGLDSTWCGFSGDPCANCNDCGDNLGYCYLDIGETECLSLSNHQWCGSNPSPTVSPSSLSSDVCANCNYCYQATQGLPTGQVEAVARARPRTCRPSS